MKAPPERLGSFYLGSIFNLVKKEVTGEVVNYDARDLTTHAVCFGMTGSGKTGLCVCLLEEAAIDRVPAIIIDPKGDITNLLLHFPKLEAASFLPWINLDDARRMSKTKDEYADYAAKTWTSGLSKWGITTDRIKILDESVDYAVYTPGSSTGIPINILSSFKAPAGLFEDDPETFRDMITGIISGLLELAGVKGDPVRDKEGILLSTIFEFHWRNNEDLTLEMLIKSVQDPPFSRLGVFDIDTFYPQQERVELAIALNSLIASPSFREWLEGENLDISKILYTEDGTPRHSVFSLAHLSDEEKMFFVTILLENIVTWVRQQPGTSSLRALLYFDEVFGYMPPVAEPPSKRPLLTLLKQARAFGLGVVIVTQNPVDIDYKGLTNTGTWFIGKLQTERDKDRVLEGLKSAVSEIGGSLDFEYDDIIGALGNRVFLLHNIHEERPIVFHTRWAMNYLRGPLTRPQIANLMKEKKKLLEKQPQTFDQTRSNIIQEGEYSIQPPTLDPNIHQVYIDPQIDVTTSAVISSDIQNENTSIVYKPRLLARYSLHFANKKRDVDKTIHAQALAPEPDNLGMIDWSEMEEVQTAFISSEPYGTREIYYEDLPEEINTIRKLKGISKKLNDFLYYNRSFDLKIHNGLKAYQKPEETLQEFTIRIKQLAREHRDYEIDKLEKKYEKQLDRLQDRIDGLSRDLSSDQAEYEARKREEVIGIGETVLGYFMGRRRTTAGTTASRRRRMTSRVKRNIEDTKEEINDLKSDYEELESELREQVDDLIDRWSDSPNKIEDFRIKPRRSDVNVESLMIAWVPYYLPAQA
jgi:hypothetical protein